MAVHIFSALRVTWPMMKSIGEPSAKDASHMAEMSFLVRLRDMMLLALKGWQMAM